MGTGPERTAMLARARAVAVRVARRQGLDPDTAEDVAQEALARLLQQDVEPANVEAWITTVTKRLVIDLGKAEARRPPPVDVEVEGVRALQAFLAHGMPVSAAGMAGRNLDGIWARLDEVLSDREKELVARIAAGDSYEEIAADMGYKNAASVRTTVKRLRRKVETVTADHLDDFRGHPHVY